MRIASIGHAVFSITMILLGILGLLRADFVPVWNPVAANVPMRELVLHLCSVISLASGIGLLLPWTQALAARLLLATLIFWLVLFRLPNFFHTSVFEACWSVFPLAVVLAATWVLQVWFAAGWDRRYLRPLIGDNGLRVATTFYGLSLMFFGAAHFIDVEDTKALIPHWLPAHAFWAYFTGCTFFVAGLAVLTGIYARLAAELSALQIASFLALVWIPIVTAGSKSSFQWSETILNAALMSAAWVVADSYRHTQRAVQ